MNLKDKITLITGGARVGQAVAETLARAGAHVAMTYRSSAKQAQAAARKVRSAGRKCFLLKADLGSENDLAGVVPAVRKALGGIDVLVHMASTYEQTPLADLEKDPRHPAWEANMDVHVHAARHLALAAAPHMRGRGGRIVHITDWVTASHRPRYGNYTPYYVSKFALQGLTESLALELAPKILVNAVAPGPILPPPGMGAAGVRAVTRETPLGRWGGPGEVAKAVLFLAQTDFVTGETIRVDGGRHLF